MFSEHPSADEIELYYMKRLSPDRMDEVAVHLQDCAECFERMEEDAALIRLIRLSSAETGLRPASETSNTEGDVRRINRERRST